MGCTEMRRIAGGKTEKNEIILDIFPIENG